jgi:ParB family chromosome partitioning protein
MLAVFGLRNHDGSEADRIMDQLRTFTREDLNLVDRVKAIEQLTLEGISVARIARTTGQSKKDVSAAIAVAKSDIALQAIDTYQLTLDRALYAAEFGEDEDALAAIADADEEELEFVAQQLRDRRELDAHTDGLIAKLQGEGKAVARSWGAGTGLYGLTDADVNAETRAPLDPETHAECPGAIYHLQVWGIGEEEHRIEQMCSRPDLHKTRYGNAISRPTTGPAGESDEEREARLEAEKDAQRRERRRVVKYNRMWRTATKLRLQWLGELVSRKKLPVDAAAFVAVTFTRFRYEAINSEHSSILGKLLGFEGHDERDQAASLVENYPAKAEHVNLAVALSGRENHTSEFSWRQPNKTDEAYLLTLESWGYHLSEVERIAAGYAEPNDDPAPVESADEDDDTVETD